MKLRIEIDDAMRVIVSHPCEGCSVMVPTDEYCGDPGQYLCCDCYAQQIEDQRFIHDWLIFLNEDHPLNCGPIAIHKDVVGNLAHRADCSTHDPEEGITRFGPGTLVLALDSINDLFFDVTDVHLLADDGIIDGKKAHTIFKIQGGAK